MKNKCLVLIATAMILASIVPTTQAVNKSPGGFKAFMVGCCLGLREGALYNEIGTGERKFVPWCLVGCCFGTRTADAYREGKSIHYREWIMLIPYANYIFHVWDGIDASRGKTRADLQKSYGTRYY